MAELTITLSDGRTLRHALGPEATVVGRDAGCDLTLDDPSASRRHARILSTPKGFVVEDLGSKNGTLVNERSVSMHVLRDGDRLTIGSTTLVFHHDRLATAGSVTIADEPTSTRATRYIGKDQQLSLSRQRLQLIYGLSHRLTTLQDRDTLLYNAMDICFEMLRFDRGAVGLRRSGTRELEWPVVRNLRHAESGLTLSRTLLTRALEHGERAIYTGEPQADRDPTVSMVQQGIRSAMCVPLMHGDEILGVLYGDRLSAAAPYTQEDIDFFAGIAQQLSVGLINHRLMQDHERMVRMTHELSMARRIQTGLFPTSLPDEPGFQVAALNEPGQRVSGDYYDVIPCGDDCWWCLIADVTGEGMAASLLTANLQAAVRVTAPGSDDPAALLARWNALIHDNTDDGTFITCLLMLVNRGAGKLRVSSAGHPAPFLLREDPPEPEELTLEPAFPLGVAEDAVFPLAEVDLPPAPLTVFAYTDGVVEAMDAERHPYGRERLVARLREHRSARPEALIRRIRKDVSRFVGDAPQSDDLTILCARMG